MLKRFAVTVVGVLLLALGVAMLVLPGPGIVVIVGGLAVLATEYVWARNQLERARTHAVKAQEAAVANPVATVFTFAFAAALIAIGLLVTLVDDVAWPVFDRRLDGFSSPVTGGIFFVTGLLLVTTTVLTLRGARGEATTYLDGPDDDSLAIRHTPPRVG